MKNMKKWAIFMTALSLAFSFGAFAACGGGNVDSSESTPTESSTPTQSNPQEQNAYTFIVKHADGTPAVGYGIQLCKGDSCLPSLPATDASGKAVVSCVADVYDIHVCIPDLENGGYMYDESYNMVYADFNEATTTPATYGEITLTLKN